jgi:hypothetical protein
VTTSAKSVARYAAGQTAVVLHRPRRLANPGGRWRRRKVRRFLRGPGGCVGSSNLSRDIFQGWGKLTSEWRYPRRPAPEPEGTVIRIFGGCFSNVFSRSTGIVIVGQPRVSSTGPCCPSSPQMRAVRVCGPMNSHSSDMIGWSIKSSTKANRFCLRM